jgi:hypothetical protein
MGHTAPRRAALCGALVLALFAAACTLPVRGRIPTFDASLHESVVRAGNAALAQRSRALRQSVFCPDGCIPGSCVGTTTTAGLRCQACMGTLIVLTADGTCGERAAEVSWGEFL